ncbi:MAG: hypothetical protein JST21_09315 [Bacteroidetes bacterium]|nr:hypothetical protein [Bacteroidota bacterium]
MLLFFSVVSLFIKAQSPILQITNSYNRQAVLYNTDSFAHTAWQPVLYTDSTYQKSNRSWLYRKFFEEHLVQVQQQGFNIFADPMFDEYLGYTKRRIPTVASVNSSDADKSNSVYMNTRGYNLSGNIGNKFYFQTDLYETQGSFPAYTDSLIRKTGAITFQSRYKNLKSRGYDWTYSTARLVYTPNKHLLFNLGYGTNFIGDGYRSLLLGDYNTPYPYFRTAINFGNFQYSVMYAQYITDFNAYTYAEGYPRKWGQTYLLDWHATKQFNIGIFNSVISSIENSDHKRDFGFTHFSPIIFLHASKSPSGLSNNDIYGLNLKYSIFPSLTAYGQFMLDNAGSNDWQKRYGFQLGVRSGDLFRVKNLNAQLEFNTVRPYSYAADTLTTAYTHNNQSLAHPMGANFKEGLFVADYSIDRWYFRIESIVARYGVDSSKTDDYGMDVTKPLFMHSVTDNVTTGQGLRTKMFYGDARVAYVFNKKTNMRLEAGATFRKEKNSLNSYTDTYFYFGVRMSFRKLIYDF